MSSAQQQTASTPFTLDQFTDYTNRGFALCKPTGDGKAPGYKNWNLKPITRFFGFGPDDAVGLLCGPLSGVIV